MLKTNTMEIINILKSKNRYFFIIKNIISQQILIEQSTITYISVMPTNIFFTIYL